MFEIGGSTSNDTIEQSHPPSVPATGAPPPKATQDTSPAKAWADALRQATIATPQQSVTVDKGSTLSGIADSQGDPLAEVEKDNPKITNPNRLRPGQMIILPTKTPEQIVSGVDNSRIQPIIAAMAKANAAGQSSGLKSSKVNQDDLAQSAPIQDQAWNAVQKKTLKMLLDNNAGAYPEQQAAAQINQLNALEPGNVKFAAANNAALKQAKQQWTQMGVTKSQLSPIIDAYNHLKQTTDQANQYLQNPKMPHNRGIEEGFNSAEQQAQNQLKAAIETSLTDAAEQAGSDPKARSKAITERAMYIQVAGPQDLRFQAAVDNANYDLQVTKPAQAVADAYAKGGTEAAADKLKSVTQNAGNSYYAAQIIQQSKGTIDRITKNLGSMAAASPPKYNPGFGGKAAGEFPPVPTNPGDPKFNQIYDDLSQSVAAADPISENGPPDPNGVAAAGLVANSISANAPKNLTSYQQGLYSNAAANSIGNGDGAGLTFATAAVLKQHGDPGMAAVFVRGATAGIQALQSRTDSDVSAFAQTTNSLHELETDFGPFLTGPNQLSNAIDGYAADNPKVAQSANQELNAISRDGDAVADANSAWTTYSGQLGGVDRQRDLSGAMQSLNDTSAGFALLNSSNLVEAVNSAEKAPPTTGAGSGAVLQAILASPGWSVARGARSFINAAFKNQAAQAKLTGGSPAAGDGTFTTLSVIGLGLTVESSFAKGGFHFGSLQDDLSDLSTAAAFGKYGIEVASGGAKLLSNQSEWFSKSEINSAINELKESQWFNVIGSTYYAAGAAGSFLEGVSDFRHGDIPGSLLEFGETASGVLNAAKPLLPWILKQNPGLTKILPNAIQDFTHEGTPLEALLRQAKELGGADGEALLSKAGAGSVLKAAGEALGELGSGIGWAVAIGQTIYAGLGALQDAGQYYNDSVKFLQDGLQLKPEIADQIAIRSGWINPVQISTNRPGSAADGLTAFANANGVTPEELLKRLNQQPVDKAIEFIDLASEMPMQTTGKYAGTYAPTEPHENRNIVSESGVPGDLTELKFWADSLFGKNWLG